MDTLAIELISSMILVNNIDEIEKKIKKEFSNISEANKIKGEEIEILKKMNGLIDEDTKYLCKKLFKVEDGGMRSFGSAIWDFTNENEDYSIKSFFQWLKDIAPKKYFEYYLRRALRNKNINEISKENLLDILKKNKVSSKKKMEILEIYFNLEEELENIKKMFERFYEDVFICFEEEIEKKVKAIENNLKAKIEKDGVDSLYIPKVKKGSKVIVSYMFLFSLIQTRNERCTLIGHRLMKLGKNPSFGIGDKLDILKILADEKRLEIIEILKKERLYAREIGDRLKLAKSTISHHINMLWILGVLITEKEENKIYYSLNMENYKNILRNLKEDLLS